MPIAPIAGIDTMCADDELHIGDYCPPLRGLISLGGDTEKAAKLLPPIAGIDIMAALRNVFCIAIAPHCGD